MNVKSESEVTQSCPTVSDPIDCSLPGSSVHGIFQARVLEWVAIAFSNMSYTATCCILFKRGKLRKCIGREGIMLTLRETAVTQV